MQHKYQKRDWRVLAALGLTMTSGCAWAQPARTAGYVWLEGEAPTHANIEVKPDGFGGGQISGDKWLNINIEAKDAEKAVPKEGLLLDYDFSAPSDGHYQLWNRLGFEVDRPPFDFRVDDGDWKTVAHEAPTSDLTELALWTHISWLKMGEADLTQGQHTLHIRVNALGADGKPQKIHYVSDALAIVKGDFHPNGKYKPDDTSWRTDADKAAAKQVFQLPAPTGAAQTALSLKGQWQIGRADEGDVQDRSEPIQAAPAAKTLSWKAMAVPGDRNKEHPELTFAHRYFLRTRVNVPKAMAGRSLYLHLPAINMLGSVFVNGQLCGTTKAPFAVWDCDITKAIKPGQVNEIWVGIKDSYYGLKPEGNNNPRTRFVIPTAWFNSQQFITNQLDFPVWNHPETGILQEPTLVAAGKAYTSDVFAIPSVKSKSLGLEVTVKNPTDQPLTVSVGDAIEPLAGGKAEKTFAPKDVTVAANSEQVVKISEPWANPKLWWPDDPNQYNVVTTLSANGAPIDERRTKFGFREWDWAGKNFKLNGVNWFGRADTASYAPGAEADLKAIKAHGQTMIRLWGENGWDDISDPQAALDFFDSHGMPIRRTGIFDGEGVNYTLSPELFANWRTQLAAWAKGQRNHPSIFIWSMENEVTFINGHVTNGDQLTTREVKPAADILAALDPTRPQMVDGGNALLDDSLPVYGIHYIEGGIHDYPDWGYELTNKRIEAAQVWPISKDKPLFFGETFYSPGYDLAALAAAGGESTMVGKGESLPAVGLIGKMMSEGYRWSGVAAFHLWKGHDSDLYYNSWQPIAVLTREWDSTFASGQKVKRTFGIFNDTHYEQPLEFTWTLMVNGKKAGSKTASYTLAPGSNKKFDDVVPMPSVPVRQDGQLILSLSSGGKEVFHDVKTISVLPPFILAGASPAKNEAASLPKSGPRIAKVETRVNFEKTPRLVAQGTRLTAQNLLVFDPSGQVAAFFKSHAVGFTPVSSLGNLPTAGKVLVVGKDALDAAQSTSSALAAYASSGRAVVVLEQKNPLKYQALPAEMSPASNEGRIGFPEDLEHPAFRGLKTRDFQTWGPGEVVYRNAYEKPMSGGRSLLQVESGLNDTALVEVPAGKGVLLLSQLLIGEKLEDNGVAQQLLGNLISYGAAYKVESRPATIVAGDNGPLAGATAAIGLQAAKGDDVLAALAKPGSVALVNASPANLQTLADNLPKVQAFTQGGGWIVFNNLSPEGLASYNKLVGVDHIIRKFGREKVTFPAVRSPLTSGLATSNIVMGSGQRIFGFQAGDYPAEDAFSYVVDYDDVAPFGTSSFGAYGNIVNNFVAADGWPLVANWEAPKDGKPFDIPISLPRPETITELKLINNNFYDLTTKVNLLFDGGNKAALDVVPTNDPQTLEVKPPRAAKEVTLELAAWQQFPGKNDVLGIDNIYLKAKRTPEFYKKVRPMLNIGALVEYPQGQGGMVLCNVLFKDSEAVPENMNKKRAILSTILHNLHASFAGGKSVIAGANLAYTPIDLSKQANAYRTEAGWFGDKNFSFKGLPTGDQKFAGVRYNVYDFKTSPVPTVVMLGGNDVPGNLADHVDGIAVNQKADALFFLQAARIDQRRNGDEVKQDKRFELARYVVHYADGQSADVPVYLERDVENYKQSSPVAAIPGAQIAWSAPYAGTDQNAVAYSMQWNNPRPDVAITSVDFHYGNDRRGVPALLALTAASAR